ncbi:MAG: TadE/TadG family type IV pilus assembly protein [Pseudomonadota bacterium]
MGVLTIARALTRPARRLSGDRRGAASLEFVVVFPLLFAVIAALMEVGLLAARFILLDRGLDIAARELRLGQLADPTHDTIKTRVCEAAVVLINCERDLLLELRVMEYASAYPRNQAQCVDRAALVKPKVTFSTGPRGEVMFIRACVIVDPIFPGIGVGLVLPKDNTGGYQMISYTAFKNEPA